jgi:hypothetical protein
MSDMRGMTEAGGVQDSATLRAVVARGLEQQAL